MATITVRISDDTRDALERKASAERQTLSDFVRARLEDSVYPTHVRDEQKKELEIETLSPLERHQLSLLHRILARVLPEDANGTDGDEEYQLERAEVLERGYTKEYWVEFAGLNPELTPRQCEFVMDVLDMFRIALYSMNHIREEGGEVGDDLKYSLTFRGFDHNDQVEGQMSDYVRHLVKDDKWTEQKGFVLGHDRGNSHHRMTDIYSRMLTRYREVKRDKGPSISRSSYLLTIDQLEQIVAAQIHPANR
jgi:uncharacterized protein YfbU (UPF0304 family)